MRCKFLDRENILILIIKLICTIFFYPLIFIVTGFGLPLSDWLKTINLFQKYNSSIRILLEQVNKKIGLLDSQVLMINRIGAMIYSDERINDFEERITKSMKLELSFPNNFDPRETYLNIYELVTVDTKKYIILEIDYADFRLPEIYKYFEIKDIQ